MEGRDVAAAEDERRITALARAAVERAAPEELPLFRATSEAYLRDPAALERQRAGGKDEMLGFGAEAAMVLVTPVALSVATDVLRFLGEQIRRVAQKEGEGAVDALVDRVAGRDGDDVEAAPAAAAPPPLDLTDEQLEQVRAVALEKAKLLKLPDAKAELLADSLVGSLATA
jgi:hypothetical protein